MIRAIAPVDFELNDTPDNSMPMYVATNKKKLYGAAVILSRKVLKDIQKKFNGEPYYILPSSVHEVICVPANEDHLDEYAAMVKEINETVVDRIDILSDDPIYVDTRPKNGRRSADEDIE